MPAVRRQAEAAEAAAAAHKGVWATRHAIRGQDYACAELLASLEPKALQALTKSAP